MVSAEQVPIKHPSEIVNGAISLNSRLDTAEVISGTPTISATPSGLTFSMIQANTSVATVLGESVPIGKALQFRVSGGTSGVRYNCEATISTNATPAQTLVIDFGLLVLDE
jgi:hypothetical protein